MAPAWRHRRSSRFWVHSQGNIATPMMLGASAYYPSDAWSIEHSWRHTDRAEISQAPRLLSTEQYMG